MFITEDDTSPVCHTQVARGFDTAYDVGSVVSVFFKPNLWFLLMALDVWKEVSGVESMLATLLVPKWLLHDFIKVHSTFCDPLCQHRATIVSDRGGGRYVYFQCFSRLIIRPLVRSAARAAGYIFEASLSLNIVSKSYSFCTALVLMLLNSPSCATNMRMT
ncbi:hypothetical protein TNCV_5033941 [Trichonephila clavipes]|nr:hypothetical protein TNCV_5033941 [Trichonephila clavipes]